MQFKLQVPWIALTATANQKTEQDVLEQLQLRNVQKFKSSTYRANLYYDVIVRESLLPAKAETHMVQFIRKILFDSRERQKREGKQPEPASGIVYCQTKNECEEMVQVLQSGGIRAEVYHGGVSNKVFGDYSFRILIFIARKGRKYSAVGLWTRCPLWWRQLPLEWAWTRPP